MHAQPKGGKEKRNWWFSTTSVFCLYTNETVLALHLLAFAYCLCRLVLTFEHWSYVSRSLYLIKCCISRLTLPFLKSLYNLALASVVSGLDPNTMPIWLLYDCFKAQLDSAQALLQFSAVLWPSQRQCLWPSQFKLKLFLLSHGITSQYPVKPLGVGVAAADI